MTTTHENRPPASVAFVDQTGQMGGAEMSLLDVIRHRNSRKRAVIFEEGPFVEALHRLEVDTVVCPLGRRASAVRKQSGLLAKLSAAGDLLSHQRQLRKALDGFDVVYANTPKAFVTAAIANRATARKLVYHLRDILTASHFSSLNRKILITLANRYASCVIANSESTAAAFEEAGGNRTIVRVVPNGFDVATFDAAIRHSLAHRQAIRQAAGIAPDAPVVAVIGRVAAWKGQHVAIDAIHRLPGVQLWIVGDALFGEDEVYQADLRRQVESLELRERVTFFGHRSDVLEIIQAADAIVHCSTAPEPFGRVIVEAMLSRRPIVASRAGGALEIVADGITGFLAEPGNAPELAQCIRRALTDSDNRTKMIEAAQLSAQQRFSLDAVLKEIDQVIDQVVESARA